MMEKAPTTYPKNIDIDGSSSNDEGENYDITNKIETFVNTSLYGVSLVEFEDAILGY
jgi:hypothetical protein